MAVPLATPRTPADTSMSESTLAAAVLPLLAQPRLWSALRRDVSPARDPAQAPWSAYWSARLDPALNPADARAAYVAAHHAFALAPDRIGALLAAAAVIETYYVEEGQLDMLDGWVARLQKWLPPDGQWPSPELEAHVMGCGIGIVLRDQTHPLLARWAERGAVLVRQLAPGAVRVKLATFLLQYHVWRGEFNKTDLIVDALPGLDVAGVLPAEAMVWYEGVASHARFTAQHERGLRAVDEGLRLALSKNLSQHQYALRAYGASLALAAHDAAAAQLHLDAMRPVLDKLPQADQTHYWHYHAGLSLLRGDVTRAVECARTTLSNSIEIGGPYRTGLHLLSLGQALLVQGELQQAAHELEAAALSAQHIDAALLGFSARLMRAVCLLRSGDGEAADAELRAALAIGAQHDYRTTAGWWLPDVVAQAAQRAIERQIEPAYVQRLVRQRALPGSDPALAAWPWPLSLRSFGELSVTLADAPLQRPGGKAAQRLLDLLRALLAHGPTPLPVATALQWLWPDAEPLAQRKAFDVALLRLRRLLGDERLLRLESGRLSLACAWVWTDVGALHALMQQIGSAHGAAQAQLQRWSNQLLDLMRGPFLAGETAEWVQAARQRYRQRFVVTVAQLASHLESLDEHAAVRLYERALDVDPLAESLARRLMRLHVQRGDRAEALRVLRLCRTMLMLDAGIGLSGETLALASELGLPGA
jgi:LuxR family transcriptional regulator, maltose regulon positive regulatory protein